MEFQLAMLTVTHYNPLFQRKQTPGQKKKLFPLFILAGYESKLLENISDIIFNKKNNMDTDLRTII